MTFIYKPPGNADSPLEVVGEIRIKLPDWEKLKEDLETQGWKCDVDNEDRMGFTFYVDENTEWMRDYDKKTGRYMQMNGRQKVNLMIRESDGNT